MATTPKTEREAQEAFFNENVTQVRSQISVAKVLGLANFSEEQSDHGLGHAFYEVDKASLAPKSSPEIATPIPPKDQKPIYSLSSFLLWKPSGAKSKVPAHTDKAPKNSRKAPFSGKPGV